MASKIQVEETLRTVMDDKGKILPGAQYPDLNEAKLTKLYDTMTMVRVVDDRMMRLQRQGRLGFYMKALGEEATHMAVAALEDSDWVYPSYREQGAWFWRGYGIENFINQLFGNVNDPVKGRQMPVHHSADWLNIVSISSPVGTQIPQAVGTAMAQKIAGTKECTISYFGEGTSSMGDFHVALNFAGVAKAPCIFVCRNNGYAISVPLEKQTAAKSFAIRALGYGIHGVRVDGNDVLAVLQVTHEAAERARNGEGPTLIEAVTYRREGHSSSDDPSVYRDAKEPEEWAKKDPLVRFRGFLKDKGIWTQKLEDDTVEKHNQAITDALEAASTMDAPAIGTLFNEVFESKPWHLEEQEEWLMSQERTKNPHVHG